MRLLSVCSVFSVFFAVATCPTFAFAQDSAAYGPEKAAKPPVNADIVTRAPRPETPKALPEKPSKQWIFDESRYTNSPATGDRVLQYKAKTPAYRDPNAFCDSPHEAYPFSPAPYGPYPRYAPPRYDGSTAYDQYSAPYRPYPNYSVDMYGP